MRIWKSAVLWYIGGMGYMGLELIWRGWSHWSMFILGGLCFLVIGATGRLLPPMPLLLRTVLCGCLVTGLELGAGLLLNVRLGMGIWDYSGLRYQFMGQICAPYFGLWNLVSFGAIWADRWLRQGLFGELPLRWTLTQNTEPAGPL